MNNILLSHPANAARRPSGLLPRIGQAYEWQQQRRQLAQLGPEALSDIGLTPAQALAEAKRQFWDAPICARR